VIAGAYGGFVESSSSQGVKHRSGSLTIRVPAASFEDALHDLRGVGTVQRQSITGRDVTSQFVDIDARLRNYEAQEKVLLRLLSRATTIEGTLKVQRTLSDVQLLIEELTGERRVLSNRAELSTIEVELFEAGAPPVVQTQTLGIEKPKLSEALTRAEAVFLGLVYGIVVALAVMVPLTLVGWLPCSWCGGTALEFPSVNRPEEQPDLDPVARPQEYIAHMLSLLGDDDPAGVQAATPAALRDLASRAGEDIRTRPAEGEWSVVELIGHLTDAELVAAARYRWVLSHDAPELIAYDQDLWVDRLRHRDDPPEELLELHGVLRRANLRLWERTPPDERERYGIHAERGKESFDLLFRTLAGHDRFHLGQMRRTLDAVLRKGG
jgi:hypothetical protein